MLRTKILSRVAAFAANRKAIQRKAFRTISQTGIRYRMSALSKSLHALPEAAPQAGDRFPWLRLKLTPGGPAEDLFQKLSDTHFNLLLIGQPAVPDAVLDFGDLLRVFAVPNDPVNNQELQRAQIPQPSFFLIRPDGYIGLCGARLDASSTRDYLSQNLSLST
jgi:hypothetical protein